jgi:hypothetical protein
LNRTLHKQLAEHAKDVAREKLFAPALEMMEVGKQFIFQDMASPCADTLDHSLLVFPAEFALLADVERTLHSARYAPALGRAT